MTTRNPVKDQIAIVGLGTTPFAREITGRTPGSLALEACKNAVLDAGLTAADIDGICGSTIVNAAYVQSGLGIPKIRWWANVPVPFTAHMIEGMNAVFSGACTTALLYHAVYRNPSISRSAANDPFRARAGGAGLGGAEVNPDSLSGVMGYPAWAGRYLHEFGAKREHLGLVAINNRTNASMNEHAPLRHPISMEDYLNARMIRWPLGMLDMDLPIDGADAFVVTTAERARDLAKKPVYIHAATVGQTDRPEEELTTDLRHTGQNVVLEALWDKSDLKLEDTDVFFPYDGFTIITLRWIENVGYCGIGEAGAFLESHWDKQANRAMIHGRVPMNTHGGSLSEGGTQGSGHFREAAAQLRGEAGDRQAPECKMALLTPGGFFFNSGGAILRVD